MHGLFLEPKSARRRFLDRLVASFDPSHASRFNAYEQAVREGLRLLRGEMAPGSADPGWLSALEQQIAEHGTAIAAARLDLVPPPCPVLARGGRGFPPPHLNPARECVSLLARRSGAA